MTRVSALYWLAIGARLTIGAMVVLGALTLLQTQVENIAPSAHAQDTRRLELQTVPHLRTPGMRADGDFPSPAGTPRPNLWFATGSLNPDMALFLNRHDAGLSALRPARQATHPLIASALDREVSAELDESGQAGSFGGGHGNALRDARRLLAGGGITTGCREHEVERQLQGGGEFWTGQARSAVPTRFPTDVLTGNPHGAADPLALGPTGHPINLPATGPAGGWCRPPLMPMSLSSPLATPAFWILLLFPTMVVFVFGLSRGFRLRPVPNPESRNVATRY